MLTLKIAFQRHIVSNVDRSPNDLLMLSWQGCTTADQTREEAGPEGHRGLPPGTHSRRQGYSAIRVPTMPASLWPGTLQ
jgi:hypothetical protein